MKATFPMMTGLLLTARSVSAIVVGDYTVATNPPSGSWNVNWDHVYKYKNCSAVAVGPNWLLTAAHVADDGGSSTVIVNGTNYYQQEIIFHSPVHDPAHANKADLALVRFDKELPGTYPLYTGTFPASPPNARLNAVLIGYGRTGAVYSAYYTEYPGGNGIKRWGTQKIDGAVAEDYDAGGSTGMTYNDGIQMMFSLSDTAYEAGVGVYDSGGGTFVNSGGTWKLAGINTTRYGGPTNFTGTFAIRMPAYAAWATNVMNPAGDLDGDGIPNFWEQRYGTTTGLIASADSDGDGFTGYQEYLADTNPTNGASLLEFSGDMTAENQTFYFMGSTARQYQVFYTADDLAGTNLTWLAAHANPVWGTGNSTSITVTNTEETVFYRLRVTLP